MSAPRERFTVVFEAEPGATPAAIRLRALLKTALRRDGLKCVSIAPETPLAAPPEGDQSAYSPDSRLDLPDVPQHHPGGQ